MYLQNRVILRPDSDLGTLMLQRKFSDCEQVTGTYSYLQHHSCHSCVCTFSQYPNTGQFTSITNASLHKFRLMRKKLVHVKMVKVYNVTLMYSVWRLECNNWFDFCQRQNYAKKYVAVWQFTTSVRIRLIYKISDGHGGICYKISVQRHSVLVLIQYAQYHYNVSYWQPTIITFPRVISHNFDNWPIFSCQKQYFWKAAWQYY